MSRYYLVQDSMMCKKDFEFGYFRACKSRLRWSIGITPQTITRRSGAREFCVKLDVDYINWEPTTINLAKDTLIHRTTCAKLTLAVLLTLPLCSPVGCLRCASSHRMFYCQDCHCAILTLGQNMYSINKNRSDGDFHSVGNEPNRADKPGELAATLHRRSIYGFCIGTSRLPSRNSLRPRPRHYWDTAYLLSGGTLEAFNQNENLYASCCRVRVG